MFSEMLFECVGSTTACLVPVKMHVALLMANDN